MVSQFVTVKHHKTFFTKVQNTNMSFEDFYPEPHYDTVGFADVLEVVASNVVWSPANHGEFSPTFRHRVRQALLGARHASRHGLHLHVAAMDALCLQEEDDVKILGGVAYAHSTDTNEEDIVLYEVDCDGELLEDYSVLPFTSPWDALPPKTTNPAAHRDYLRHVQVNQDMLGLYPEVFSGYPRKRAFYKSNLNRMPDPDEESDADVQAFDTDDEPVAQRRRLE